MSNEEKNELVIQTTIKPAVLEINYEELEKKLDEKLEEFRNLVFVDDEKAKDAKAAQKELSAMRTSLENSRKEVKKKAEAPIKEFDNLCKKLNQKICEVEAPIKEVIEKNNEKVREEKKAFAQEQINKAADKYGLRPEYASQILLKAEYLNLTGTKKSVVEDVSLQAEKLKMEQDAYDDKVNAIYASVNNENMRINIKLNPQVFIDMLGRGVSLPEIISQVKAQADDIYDQENKKEEIATDVTSLFMPESQDGPMASANQGTVYGQPSEPPCFPSEMPVFCPVIPDDDRSAMDSCEGQDLDANLTGQYQAQPYIGGNTDMMPIKMPVPPVERNYRAVFEVTGNFQALRMISDFLKGSGVTYRTISQEKI